MHPQTKRLAQQKKSSLALIKNIQHHCLLRKGVFQGAFWAVMINVSSTMNDVIMTYMGKNLHWVEISFFRFLFSTLVVLPFMFRGNGRLFKTTQPLNHLWRGLIGGAALSACCFSLQYIPIVENSTILFTEPIFFLVFAYIFLKEDVDWKRWTSTIFGFIGLIVVLQPSHDKAFQLFALVPVVAAIMFAVLNVMAKLMIAKEHTLTLLFYFGVVTTLMAAVPLYWFWTAPSMKEIFFLIGLGIGANLIQLCLFLAFNATQASAIAPFRYVELVTGAVAGLLFFGQIPQRNVLMGAGIIIASTLFLMLQESRKTHD